MYIYQDTFICAFEEVFENWDKWETRGTIEDIHNLETAERMVMADEAMIQEFFQSKMARSMRRINNAKHKASDRVRTRSYQRKADAYKRNCKKKGYDLKQKGQTRKAHAIVPSDALGWDKIGMEVMGEKLHGIKVGYIFAVT